MLGIFGMLSGMLTEHLDADPLDTHPASFRTGQNDASTRARHEQFLANRRGTAFGVPRDAYATAVAAMHAMERRDAAGMAVPLAASTPTWTALGPLPIANEVPIFGNDLI